MFFGIPFLLLFFLLSCLFLLLFFLQVALGNKHHLLIDSKLLILSSYLTLMRILMVFLPLSYDLLHFPDILRFFRLVFVFSLLLPGARTRPFFLLTCIALHFIVDFVVLIDAWIYLIVFTHK